MLAWFVLSAMGNEGHHMESEPCFSHHRIGCYCPMSSACGNWFTLDIQLDSGAFPDDQYLVPWKKEFPLITKLRIKTEKGKFSAVCFFPQQYNCALFIRALI